MAKLRGTPTPIPTPTATWFPFGRGLEEGVTNVTSVESDSPDEVGSVVRVGTVELVEIRALVVGFLVVVWLIGSSPRLVCIVTGPEPKENNREWVEQHPGSLVLKQQYLLFSQGSTRLPRVGTVQINLVMYMMGSC